MHAYEARHAGSARSQDEIKAMAQNYAQIAFTENVKAQQEKYGSRKQYARMEEQARGTELAFPEADFISERDSFYISTVSENRYPYVQFRGGPKGFLKVLDQKTLAYADFRGNLQYVSVGNLNGNNKAALILMDYVNRRRLKIYASVEIVDAKNAPELIAELQDTSYKAQVERAMILHVEAFDWNCPQHITPRYTIEELSERIKPLHKRIEELEAEIAHLKTA